MKQSSRFGWFLAFFCLFINSQPHTMSGDPKPIPVWHGWGSQTHTQGTARSNTSIWGIIPFSYYKDQAAPPSSSCPRTHCSTPKPMVTHPSLCIYLQTAGNSAYLSCKLFQDNFSVGDPNFVAKKLPEPTSSNQFP